jgi:hypothetical protein
MELDEILTDVSIRQSFETSTTVVPISGLMSRVVMSSFLPTLKQSGTRPLSRGSHNAVGHWND